MYSCMCVYSDDLHMLCGLGCLRETREGNSLPPLGQEVDWLPAAEEGHGLHVRDPASCSACMRTYGSVHAEMQSPDGDTRLPL